MLQASEQKWLCWFRVRFSIQLRSQPQRKDIKTESGGIEAGTKPKQINMYLKWTAQKRLTGKSENDNIPPLTFRECMWSEIQLIKQFKKPQFLVDLKLGCKKVVYKWELPFIEKCSLENPTLAIFPRGPLYVLFWFPHSATLTKCVTYLPGSVLFVTIINARRLTGNRREEGEIVWHYEQ